MKHVGITIMALLASSAHARIVTQTLPYQHGEIALEGYLAYDDARPGKRPGVLVVHEWWGLNDFAKEQARKLAELGYVALAVDMYGQGLATSDPEQAGKLAGQFRDNATLWRERAKAAYDVLVKQERGDPTKIGAIGFCFGGSTVLQMAASGLNLAGVVSFHGGLTPFGEADARQIRTKILVLHGAADTHVPDETVKAFEDALRKTSVDWQIVIYAGAKHGFTNPGASKLGMDGVGYDEKAARRSWEHMRLFFSEVFGQSSGAE